MPTYPIKAYKSIHAENNRETAGVTSASQSHRIIKDLTPLDILLSSMRQKWRDGDRVNALALAKIAAPYVHPRKAINKAINRAPAELPTELHRLTDEELAIRLAEAQPGATDPADGPHEPD